MGPLLLLAIQAVGVPAAAAPPADEIVVVARHSRCDVRLADRVLSAPDFDRHAAEWAAGRPVRVAAPAGAKVKCLAKIMFRLADHGVTHAVFVDDASTP